MKENLTPWKELHLGTTYGKCSGHLSSAQGPQKRATFHGQKATKGAVHCFLSNVGANLWVARCFCLVWFWFWFWVFVWLVGFCYLSDLFKSHFHYRPLSRAGFISGINACEKDIVFLTLGFQKWKALWHSSPPDYKFILKEIIKWLLS